MLPSAELIGAENHARKPNGIPLDSVTPENALADQAVRRGGRIVVLCAAPTTMKPTRDLFARAARESNAEVETALVPGVWDLFKAGQIASYHAAIAEAARATFKGGANTVALAQASMAGAGNLLDGPEWLLTSPAAGLASLRKGL